ncbi:MAG: bifunctional diaminohydroxyphosphoribosylaminopyrimidine deaminase/5-amino-6-(5-phosphoribosylamino)uracil reductase RibD [Gilvibacter sp.]
MSDAHLLQNHETFMKRCLQLASKGLGSTYPNPLVGSVLVNNGKVIGEGWHKKAGDAHAEVVAINSVVDTTLFSEATIYVSLEPCCHHGKTPPCTDLIIKHKIKEVVVGCLDPNPKVAGKGIAQLKAAGCDVKVGILEEECAWMNRRFFTSYLKQRPYIVLKWAQSIDGFLSPEKRANKAPVWITGTTSRQLVHKWRSEEQAILIGINTVLDDNPSLTTRLVSGTSPHRIVIDPTGKIPPEAAILKNEAPTTVLSQAIPPQATLAENVTWITTQESMVKAALQYAQKNGLQSIIVEGGAYTLQRFIDLELWDEARIFTGPIAFNKGIAAPEIQGNLIEEKTLETDRLRILTPIAADS